MRKHSNIVLLMSVMILALAIIVCGCGATVQGQQEGADENADISKITATIEIVFPEDAGMDNQSAELQANEGATVEEMTVQYCMDTKQVYNLRKSSGYQYFDNICGVSEGDFGSDTGWVYEVNGESVMLSSDLCEVKDGDVITWKFVSYSEMEM